jgi:hypothetical protein
MRLFRYCYMALEIALNQAREALTKKRQYRNKKNE